MTLKLRRVLNYLFLRLLSGDLIMFLGTPVHSSISFFKRLVVGSGHLHTQSSYQGKILLTQGHLKKSESRIPSILLVFDTKKYSNLIKLAKEKGVVTIGLDPKDSQMSTDFSLFSGQLKKSLVRTAIIELLVVYSLSRTRKRKVF